jgi:hypothetical protein
VIYSSAYVLLAALHILHAGRSMNSFFSICTKEEQYAVIRFLWADSVPGTEMHCRLSALVLYG